jgi:hypothetical protein
VSPALTGVSRPAVRTVVDVPLEFLTRLRAIADED